MASVEDRLAPLRDATRLRILSQAGVLDSAPAEILDRYTRLAAKLLDVPTSLVSLVDDRRQYFTSAFGLGEPWATLREAPLSHSICKYVVASGEALVLDHAPSHPLVRDDPVLREQGVMAYAGVPLEVAGHSIGVMCVVDSKLRSWSQDDLATLRALADAVAAQMQLNYMTRRSRDNDDLLDALTDSALDAIVTCDDQGRILFCNRAAQVMFQRSYDELLNLNVTALMPERYRDDHLAGMEKLRRGGPPHLMGRVVELQGIRRDGSEFPLELSLSRHAPLITAVIRDSTERNRTTQALRDTEELLRLTVDNAPIGIALVATDGRWLRVNDALAAIVGYSREELLQSDFQRITHPADLDADLALVRQLLRGDIPRYELEKRYIRKDGESVSVILSVSLVRSPEGHPRFFIAQVQDITARVAAERSALRQAAIMHAVLESMGDVVIVADHDGRILLLNQVGERLFGPFLAQGVPEQWPADYGLFLSDKVTRCQVQDYPLMRALRGESLEQQEMWIRMPGWEHGRWHSVTANPVCSANGELLGAVNVGRDITARKEMEERVRQTALTDELTGLYNRRGMMLMGEQQLRVAQRQRQPMFLLYIDLDGMKAINDRLGHERGDEALVETATLLMRACRASDLVARLGGDEFVVLAAGHAATADILVARLQRNLTERNDTQLQEYVLSMSIGRTCFDPDRPSSLSQLLAAGDEAMYEVKRRLKTERP